jgi:hypothetical protein
MLGLAIENCDPQMYLAAALNIAYLNGRRERYNETSKAALLATDNGEKP